jgi:hypothetical protein
LESGRPVDIVLRGRTIRLQNQRRKKS